MEHIIDAKLLNGLSLAYIGDSVYEIYVRKHFILKGHTKVNDLHNLQQMYTKGERQSFYVQYLLNNDILKEDEIEIYKRGRNSHIHSRRNNINIKTYLEATGFEAIIGYLFLQNNISRLEELINLIFKLGEDDERL